MNRLRCAGTAILLAMGSVVPVDAQVSLPGQASAIPCEVGSYLMADGTTLDIGPGESGQLRWRRLDGRTGALTLKGDGRWTSTLGWTDRPDGHTVTIYDCGRGGIRFDDVAGRLQPLIQVDTRFQGSGVVLVGRLTLPPGRARVPIVVLIHGAEHESALEDYALQRQFASQGIGVFAYVHVRVSGWMPRCARGPIAVMQVRALTRCERQLTDTQSESV